MTAITPDAVTAHEAPKVKAGLGAKLQTVVYSLIFGQWAVGFWSGVYVLVFQAHWFGKSLKYIWDNLNTLWHFKAIPLIGDWIYHVYPVGRHIELRDVPESILAYALVSMVVAPFIPGLVTKVRDTPPFLDRVMLKLRMPSAYQGRPTSGLQYLFLMPSMLAASLPGVIPASALAFGFIASMHRWDPSFHAGWLTADAAWVYIFIGIVGGKFAGHKPAVKAAQDIQGFYLNGRLALRYKAEAVLSNFKSGSETMDAALNALTKMRAATPSGLYPVSYRLRYQAMVRERPDCDPSGVLSRIITWTVVAVVFVVGGWGTYLRHWGIAHGFWLPW